MEKREEGIFIPGTERENMDLLDSMVAMMVADIVSNEEVSPPRAEAPTDYSANSNWIYSPQIDPTFVQCHGMSGEGTQHYNPESTVSVNAATRDVSAYQILSPTTSLLQSVASSSNSQQLGEDASRKELRLIKNRQAAKDSRRRKKEYIKYLEAGISMLELENNNLMEEINYLKVVFGQMQQ